MEVYETHQNDNQDGSATTKKIESSISTVPGFSSAKNPPRQQPCREHIFDQVRYRLIKSPADVDSNIKSVFVQHVAHQGSNNRIYDGLGTKAKVCCPLLEVSGLRNFYERLNSDVL